MAAGPDFLGIGVQKAGTSWLAGNLAKHPDLWLAPEKELHYFDRAPRYASPDYLAAASRLRRFIGRGRAERVTRAYLIERIQNTVRKKKWENLPRDLNFVFSRYDDDWYRSLFTPGIGKICGEYTPSYAILELEDIQHVHSINPDMKVIIVLRDLVERQWSYVRFVSKRRYNSTLEIDLPIVKKYADEPGQDLRSDYTRMISQWRSIFPEEQIFIGFYDDIVARPREFLLEVFQFLGADSSEKHLTKWVSTQMNASPKQEMPADIRRYLTEKYLPQTEKLSNMIGGHSTDWLERMKSA